MPSATELFAGAVVRFFLSDATPICLCERNAEVWVVVLDSEIRGVVFEWLLCGEEENLGVCGTPDGVAVVSAEEVTVRSKEGVILRSGGSGGVSIACSVSGQLAVGRDDGSVVVLDGATLVVLYSLESQDDGERNATVHFSPCGRLLASTTERDEDEEEEEGESPYNVCIWEGARRCVRQGTQDTEEVLFSWCSQYLFRPLWMRRKFCVVVEPVLPQGEEEEREKKEEEEEEEEEEE